MKMVDMEYDDEDKADALQPIAMPDRPDYPYGLCISLTEKELKKLNLDPSEAKVGGVVHGHFIATIKSVSKNETDNGDCCRIELQMEKLAVEAEDEENDEMDAAEEKPARKRRVLYAD